MQSKIEYKLVVGRQIQIAFTLKLLLNVSRVRQRRDSTNINGYEHYWQLPSDLLLV